MIKDIVNLYKNGDELFSVRKDVFFVDGLKEAKNLLIDKSGQLFSVKNDEYFAVCYKLMPDISDVKVIDNDKCKVVQVFFADDTVEKAVLNAEDNYSYDCGISVCIAKKLLSMHSGGQGNVLYNKLIARAKKITEKNERTRLKEEKEKKAKEARYKKFVEKKKAKRERREAEAKEKVADLIALAIMKAQKLTS